jgi:protein phosphatase
VKVIAAAATDIGQVREGNEDAYLVLPPLFAVADGMGGHRGGEVASNLALQTIQSLFESREGELTEQVERANRAVFERSQVDREVAGMGTTLTAALVEGARARLAHVGDSRAYLLRAGELHLLTEDHTLVHRMVQEGEITPAEAETHPHRSILTRALGVEDVLQVDEGEVELVVGDRLLLCTDGLTAMVSEREIRAVLADTPDPHEAVERLVRAANEAGGIDNITVVLLEVADDRPSAAADRGSGQTGVSAPERPPGHDTVPSSAPPPATGTRSATRARQARRIGIGAGIAIGAIAIGVTTLRLYLDTQWFVGVSNGRVAIFRGVPAEVAGFDLNSVVLETTIPAQEAESLAYYRTLPEGITADDRESANAIVEQIRSDVALASAAGP